MMTLRRGSVALLMLLCACGTDTFIGDDAGDATADTTLDVLGDGPVDAGPSCQCDTDAGVCEGNVCVVPMAADACLVAAGGYVYWTNGRTVVGGGAIYRIQIASKKVELVADGQDQPRALAADDTRIYWTNMAAIMSAPLGASQTPTKLTMAANPVALAVNGSELIYGQQDMSVYLVPTTGGSTTFVDNNSGVPAFMHAAGDRFFWTANEPPNTTADAGTANLVYAPLDGGMATTDYTSSGNFTGFEVNANGFTTYIVASPSQGRLFTLVNTAVPLTNAVAPDDLIQDTDQTVYWSERRDGGGIDKLAAIDTTPTKIATEDFPHCIAVVAPNVYWTAPGRILPGVAGL